MKTATNPKVVTGLEEHFGPGLNKWRVTITIPGRMKNALHRTVIAKSHQAAKRLYIEYNARCNGDPEQSLKKWEEHLRSGHIKAWRTNLILRPYFVTDQPGEWAMIVFHYTAQKARVLGWRSWPYIDLPDDGFLSVRATRADDEYMMFAERETPHVVDTYDGDYETWQLALEAKKEVIDA